MDYNRYSDILTYKDNRVILKPKSFPNNDTDYINASFVDSPFGPDERIIAAQGPLKGTIRHFWRMIIQEDVTLIITLCDLVENKRSKCE